MGDEAKTEDTLKARLLDDPSKRPAILADCVRLIDDEVSRKGGLSGVAIKGGYKVVGKIKPGIFREAMDSLLDSFVDRLEPFWAEHRKAGGDENDFPAFLSKRSDPVADALLSITDARAARANNKTIKKAYEKLRPKGKDHVREAVPGVARTLSKHL